MVHCIVFFVALMFCTSFTQASKLKIDSVRIGVTDSSFALNRTVILCNLSWENSWRDNVNWDAVWVFVKYKTNDGTWEHATLSTDALHYKFPAEIDITPAQDGKGIFIYRKTNGVGNLAIIDLELAWKSRTDGVVTKPTSSVKVFGLEMVYVPDGEFFIGDGSLFNVAGHFADPFQSVTRAGQDRVTATFSGIRRTPAKEAKEINRPAHIESECEIFFGNSTNDHFGNSSGKGMLISDDVPRVYTNVVVPEHFPKGTKAFYCMKYEISQGLYAAFLNTLTDLQAASLAPEGNSEYRYTIRGKMFSYTAARPERACNYLDWRHGAAFSDWAALRPMTELEFEKACRGPQRPSPNEYAWGALSIVPVEEIVGEEIGTETFLPEHANCNSTMGDFKGGDGGRGPLRCGLLEKPNMGRAQPGASYYGIMELSGNLWEQCVTVGDPQGRRFTGLHGDGRLELDGSANVERWPSGVNGMGYRGGSWSNQSFRLRVSDRQVAVGGATARVAEGSTGFNSVTPESTGFRGVRTAEQYTIIEK